MNKDKWQVIDFKIGDIVIFDYYNKSSGESIPITGEIVYMSSVDNTINVKSHFGGSIVNIGKERLKLNLLSPNNKKYDAR